jgi:hypothetical protein
MTSYGKTPIGQLLYDLAFTKLSERYLARKHKLPIAEIRQCRQTATRILFPKRKKRKAAIRAQSEPRQGGTGGER